jgi:hypothetical protein
MLIVALVLAVIGLAALVTAVVTSNELIAWVCIAASVIGVILLIVDAVRERSRPDTGGEVEGEAGEVEGDQQFDEEYPEEAPAPARYDDEPETSVVEQAEGDVSEENTNR